MTDLEAVMKMLTKRTKARPALAGLIAALALAAGCGGDEQLSNAETAKEVNAAVQSVNREFQDVFELLGRRKEGERVPANVRARLRTAATAERRVAGEVAAIEPPAKTATAVDGFVRAARRQADALEIASGRTDLTVAQLADTVEDRQMRAALVELQRQRLARPPDHQ